MIKYVKPALFLLSFFLFLPSIKSQEQLNFNEKVTEKFLKFCEAIPREEIFVHTDREEYIAGEDIWFNLYLIDRQSNKPSADSKLAYFELLNPDNRPVVQKRIKIEKGFGPGQIVLPDTLSAGRYTLRVYTNWMKNFLPGNCFMKNINIYNAISSRSFKGKSNSGNFFPKGANINNSTGLSDKGIAWKVNNLKFDTLEILLNTDDNFRSRNGNLCYLFIQTHGVINLTSSINLRGENTRFDVPKNVLIPGINDLVIFDSRGNPLLERYIYTPVKRNQYLTLNSFDSCKIRNKITLEVEFDKELTSSLTTTNLSISVAPETNYNLNSDLIDYMVFGSEFGILPDEIRNSKLNELPPEILDNFLLNVKSNWIGWKSILSGDLPFLKYKMENEEHFISGRLVNKNTQLPDSDKYLFLSIPGKDAVFQYAKTDNEGNFSFNIPITEKVQDIIIQPEEVDRNNMVKIESSFSEDYLPVENLPDSLNKLVPTHILKWSVNYQVRKIYGSTLTGGQTNRNIPLLRSKRFYGKPDIELVMDDYIKLPVMQEVFFELIPGVFLKNRKSIYDFSIADPVDNKIYEKPPVLMIDGVVIDDPSIIANLDPEFVEKIDAVKAKYFVGDYLFYGLVNVITRAGNYSSVNLPDYAVRMPYRVIEPVNSFISPDYSTEEKKLSRIPDFRNTLYWNSSITPDKNGIVKVEFWASDYTSDYKIDIQGITSEGKNISYMKIIEIK